MKTITFKAARAAALDYLDSEGWAVKRGLKVPHATAPGGDVRLWFKPQAVYLSHGERHRFGDARSLHVDIRRMTPAELAVDAIAVAGSRASVDEPRGEPAPSAPCACDICRRRRGCFVISESDAPMPAGWCEVQRDDSPDWEDHLVHRFADDIEAALWVSPAARAVSVETGASTPLVEDADGDLVIPAVWCCSTHRLRIIVPILDAIDRGLLEEDAA